MGIIRSQAQWQNIFKDQQTSGLTIIGYCREHQLATATFYAARKKLGVKPINLSCLSTINSTNVD
jgi:putative transposase